MLPSRAAGRLVDEIVGRADEAIGAAHGRARHELEQLKLDTATKANEKVRLLELELGLSRGEQEASSRRAYRLVRSRSRSGSAPLANTLCWLHSPDETAVRVEPTI